MMGIESSGVTDRHKVIWRKKSLQCEQRRDTEEFHQKSLLKNSVSTSDVS